MERKDLEDKEQTGNATDSPAGYIYRGIRYGGPMPEAGKQTRDEPKSDDPVKPSVASDDPLAASPRQGQPQESAVDRPWWEGPWSPGDDAEGKSRTGVETGDNDPDSETGFGYYYMGVRYGGPEPQTEETKWPDDDDPVNPIVLSVGADEPDGTPPPVVGPDFTTEPVARSGEEQAVPPAQAKAPGEVAANRPWLEQPSAPAETGEEPGTAFGDPAVPPVEQQQRVREQVEPSGGDVAARRTDPGLRPVAAADLPAVTEELSAEAPVERIRSLVAAVCPDEMLSMETFERPLPAWAPAAMNAARVDLERRVTENAPINAAEHLRLAIVESLAGRYDEAEAHLKEALLRSDRLGPVLNALAVTSAARGKIAPAVVYAREALQESGGDDSVHAAVASNLGDFHRLQGNETQAAEAYHTAIESLGTQGDPRCLSRLHLGAGRLYRHMDQADKARMHLSEAVRLFKEAGDDAGGVRALAALGATLTESGSHDLAVRNLEEGIRICLRTGDRPAAALVQQEIGVAYMAQDQMTRALAYLEGALTLHRELGNTGGEAATLENIGQIHDLRGDADEAQRFREAAKLLDNSQADK